MKSRQHRQINLMPASYRGDWRSQSDLILLGFLAFVVLVSAGSYFKNRHQVKSLDFELQGVLSEKTTVVNQVTLLKRNLAESSLSAEQQKLVSTVMGVKFPWAETFKELSLVVPENTWLTKFSAENIGNSINMALIGETESQAKMASFFANLEKSEHFKNLMVVSSQLKKSVSPPLYEFIFTSPGQKTEVVQKGGGSENKN